jgi:multiple sugar transport system permease protein
MPRFRRRFRRNELGLGYNSYLQIAGVVMATPAILLLSLLILGPFVLVIIQSFNAGIVPQLSLANYRWLLGQDVLPAIGRSLYIGIGSVALEVLVAVPLALLLNQNLPGRGLMRALTTLPWAVPTITVATAFLWLSDPEYGIFNQVGMASGVLKEPLALLGSYNLALPAVTVAHAWKGLPLVFIIVLSALQSLSPEYVEAGRVDGARNMALFRYIVLPHLRSSIALAAVLSGIYNFALFDITYLLTGGGPSDATTTLPLLLYNQEFLAGDNGRSSAVGVTIFLAGLIALGLLFLVGSSDRRRRI